MSPLPQGLRLHRRSPIRTLAVLAAFGIAASACSSAPTTLHGIVRDEPLRVGEVTLPDVTANSAPDATLTMRPEPGRLLVVYFGYTFCPDVCPTTLAALRRAYRTIGADAERVDTAMVTVDPRRDTPEVLNTYLSSFFPERYHAIRTLDMAGLAVAEDEFLASSTVLYPAEGDPQVSHTGTTYVVGPDGTVLVEWPFGLDAQAITEDLRILLDRTEAT